MSSKTKVTLDHNCLIHLQNGGEVSKHIRAILSGPRYECYVANVGASELLQFGVRPDNYVAFENFLAQIGVSSLPRLDPIGVWGVTFLDRCLFAGAQDEALLKSIRKALFGDEPVAGAEMSRRDINRLCDALSMWCHISHGNDIFLTTDSNFSKATKLPKLIAIGARAVRHPSELVATP